MRCQRFIFEPQSLNIAAVVDMTPCQSLRPNSALAWLASPMTPVSEYVDIARAKAPMFGRGPKWHGWQNQSTHIVTACRMLCSFQGDRFRKPSVEIHRQMWPLLLCASGGYDRQTPSVNKRLDFQICIVNEFMRLHVGSFALPRLPCGLQQSYGHLSSPWSQRRPPGQPCSAIDRMAR